MIRIYTFTIVPPKGTDLVVAGQLMTKQLDRMMAQSRDIVEADVEATETGEILLRIMYQARDAWYIHKKIKFPLVAALRRANLKMEHLKATQVTAPVSGRERPAAKVAPATPWLPVAQAPGR